MSAQGDELRQVRQALAQLNAPDPFSVERFRRSLECQRQRRLIIKPWPGEPEPDRPCGVWVSTDSADLVFHESGTTPLHRDQIILHEFAHMILDHRVGIDADFTRRLLPDLDPAMIRYAMGRTSYRTEQERQAELLATMLMDDVHHRHATTGPDAPGSLRRMADILAPRRGHRA